MITLPVDAVPDITNNQVQIVTISPTLAPQEVEKLITFPIEIAMSNIMNVIEIRSVSRFGLSVVTVVFEENIPTLDARQLVNEQIQTVSGEIPSSLGVPTMMPISTGLGEIYQYYLEVDPKYKDKYNAMELRTIQDWVVKRNMSGIPGIVEINSFGGYLKQYEVAIDPDALFSLNITILEVFDALSKNNQNTGGAYIEKNKRAYYIRSEGMIKGVEDIENVVITNRGGVPIHIKDVAKVNLGSPKRFGAMTIDGEEECVGGIAMMLKGANANQVTEELEKRVEKVQEMLPDGVKISPYLNRSELVSRNISTVIFNLIEGAIIVFLVLILFLGNVRGGLIVASVIPLAMLFAFIMMRLLGVSANLMSLGAIDFGIVVDGAIVIVEGILAHIYTKKFDGKTLTKSEMENEVAKGVSSVIRSATFAVLIILIVFFPILTLKGIEGKYFTPMAQTLVFCIIGALILSLTYVPMMSSLILKRKISLKPTFADRFFKWLNGIYQKSLAFALKHSWGSVITAFAALAFSLFIFTKLGSEFIPTLDEGDFAMQMTLPAGSSLTQSIEVSKQAEKVLLSNFPEIKHVVAKIGTAEVPTDPMAVEDADIMIVMKPFKEWVSAKSRSEMVDKMKSSLDTVSGAEFNFSQPIQLRFNELMTGSKADIAIKLYGEDMEELYKKGIEASNYIKKIPGASDVLVEQAMGLPQLVVNYDRDKIARYGVNIEEINDIIRTAYAGESSGIVFENERRFDLVVRLDKEKFADLNLHRFFVRTGEGVQIPVSELARVDYVQGPLQINRDATKRRIVIGVNVRGADIGKVVAQIQNTLDENIKLQPGYHFEYGGQFENLQNAINTLLIVIPVALMLILLLLFFAFKSITYSLVVFTTIPLSLIGGILALYARGLPFSISAGVGFIALFGVAVLNGILMINHFRELRNASPYKLSVMRVIERSTPHLLRPVFLTGIVASLGFIPMAIATSAGAEVQRPLATVVIGGLLVSTVLTLIIIPVFYRLVQTSRIAIAKSFISKLLAIGVVFILIPIASQAQIDIQKQNNVKAQTTNYITLDQAISMALSNDPRMKVAAAAIERNKASKGESWEITPTSIEYGGGQINGTRYDNQLIISQSIGSPITPFYKNALAKNRTLNATIMAEIVKREIVAEVKRAWITYIYTNKINELYTTQKELADKLYLGDKLRYDMGEISLLEEKASESLSLTTYTQLLQAQKEYKMAAERLRWVCFSQIPITPSDTNINITDPSTLQLDSTSLLYSNYYQGLNKEQRAILNVEKSRISPEIFASYHRQTIVPEKGLNSYSVGITFPIIFNTQLSKIRQAKYALAETEGQSEAAMREINMHRSELYMQIELLKENIEIYDSTLLDQAKELRRATQLQLNNNNIDISQAIQAINSAIKIEESYIYTLYQYNIALLEYEMYK